MGEDRLTEPSGAMRAYYERRAAEYDDWWEGTGRFADRDRPGWDAERDALRALLAALPAVPTLDVACGTGYLSRSLPGDLTLLDQSAAMVEIAGGRIPEATALRGEAIPLPFADGSFERVVTAHFYGHLQPDEAAAFVGEARRVAGELIVIDSAGPEPRASWNERILDDGSRHSVYKRWFTGASLTAEIRTSAAFGGSRPTGSGEVLHDGDWFVAVRTTST